MFSWQRCWRGTLKWCLSRVPQSLRDKFQLDVMESSVLTSERLLKLDLIVPRTFCERLPFSVRSLSIELDVYRFVSVGGKSEISTGTEREVKSNYVDVLL